MKKLKINIVMIAAILGVTAAFAFKSPNGTKSQSNEYWFEYNSDGTQIIDPTTMPPNQTTDPFPDCVGTTTNCAASYTSTNLVSGHYVPAGTLIKLDQID